MDGEGVGASLSKSMEDTGDHAWAILIAFIVPTVLYALGLAFLTLGYMEIIEAFELPIVLGNGLLFAGAVMFTGMGIAIYALINENTGTVATVFE